MIQSFEELVKEERARQDEKWGEQNLHSAVWLAILMEEVGELSTALLNSFFDNQRKKNTKEELAQVAAVCQAMYESGVRNGWIK